MDMAQHDAASLLTGIYAIVNDGERTLEIAQGALDAGVRVIQYRAKHGYDQTRLRDVRKITRYAGALLIVNDDWRAALDFDCDGVHLGPDDEGFAEVEPLREEFGVRLIGLSCGTVVEAVMAERVGADYIGVGPVYATGSKGDAGEPIGIEGLVRVAGSVALPAAAIGGINAGNLAAVRASGVAMAAVISALEVEHPEDAARRLVEGWGHDGTVRGNL